MGIERFVRGRDDFRMVGEAKIIIRAEINDRVRLPAVIQHRAHFRRSEHLWFVKFDRPFAGLMPFRENRRRLQRIFAVADEKIAQAESTRISLDRGWRVRCRRWT